MADLTVLYEDNHIIAVVKPAGVLSQADKTGDVSMYEIVKDYIRVKKGKPIGNAPVVERKAFTTGFRTEASASSTGVFVGLLHRLDRPVSGIMLFAKTSKGASRLSEQFRNRQVEKTYHALVGGKPKKQDTLFNEDMVLHYSLVKKVGEYSLLKVSIEGGKYHQIRIQLSKAGMPIVGDVKYGGPKWENERAIALCATGLSFTAATVDKKVDVAIAIPSWPLDN